MKQYAISRYTESIRNNTTKKKYLGALQEFFEFLEKKGPMEELINWYVNRGEGSGVYADEVLNYIGWLENKVILGKMSESKLRDFVWAYDKLVREVGVTISWEQIKGVNLKNIKLPGLKRRLDRRRT